MAIDVPISLSRARRLRNSATKRRLWDAAGKSSLDSKADTQFVVGAERLYLIEAMLCQLHWQFIGQWQQAQWYFDSHSGADSLTQQVPEDHHHAIASSKLWLPSRLELFGNGSPLHEDLRHEAASLIQAFVRKRVLTNDTAESDCSSGRPSLQPCSRCGKDVVMDGTNSLGEYEADMCDRCDAVLHTSCLSVQSTLSGEWSLCPTCMVEFPSPVRCDLRSLPDSAWSKIHDLFPDCRAPVMNPPAACPSDLETPRLCPCMDEPLAVDVSRLDTTLGYILRFLEGEHAKSKSITKQIKHEITQQVKLTLAWRKQARTAQEVDDKVAELNSMMMNIVSKL